MTARTVRIARLALVSAVVAFACVAWTGSRPAFPADAKAPKLQALLKERLDAAKELYKLAIEKLDVGTALVAEVNEARLTLLRAKLDLAAVDEERLNALAGSVAEAKHIEDTVVKQIAQGLLAPIEAPRARVSRLETEIELERIKAK